MDEIMDQLKQVIEERVMELKRKSGRGQELPAYCTETEEHILRMWIESSIAFQRMTGSGWTTRLMAKSWMYRNQERLRYYKAGLADAIEVMRYLRT